MICLNVTGAFRTSYSMDEHNTDTIRKPMCCSMSKIALITYEIHDR